MGLDSHQLGCKDVGFRSLYGKKRCASADSVRTLSRSPDGCMNLGGGRRQSPTKVDLAAGLRSSRLEMCIRDRFTVENGAFQNIGFIIR